MYLGMEATINSLQKRLNRATWGSPFAGRKQRNPNKNQSEMTPAQTCVFILRKTHMLIQRPVTIIL